MEKIAVQKPRLLVLSHVLPFPGESGQQQRVANSLIALRARFHLTFLTYATPAQQSQWTEQLTPFCDEVVLLKSQTRTSPQRYWHAGISQIYAAATGLKPSNYHIGKVEFAPTRLAKWLTGKHFDLALFEYWHAVPSVKTLQSKGIRCVLDMHDILWQTYERQLAGDKPALTAAQQSRLERYRQHEEAAWQQFDAMIAINHEELRYAQTKTRPSQKLFHAAMGVNLSDWPYRWQPATPPRLAYYGGLGSSHNQRDALICAREIMPRLWQHFPDAELWLVGSRPPAHLQELAQQEPRIRITGFVKDAATVLGSMTAVLCPWQGTFGFRSRLIEAMAVGTPVIASPDAVYGMQLENEHGLWLGETAEELADRALRLLREDGFAQQQSRAARHQAETRFSLAATYGKLVDELFDYANS